MGVCLGIFESLSYMPGQLPMKVFINIHVVKVIVKNLEWPDIQGDAARLITDYYYGFFQCMSNSQFVQNIWIIPGYVTDDNVRSCECIMN